MLALTGALEIGDVTRFRSIKALSATADRANRSRVPAKITSSTEQSSAGNYNERRFPSNETSICRPLSSRQPKWRRAELNLIRKKGSL